MTDSKKLDLILEKMDTLDEKVDTLDKRVTILDEKVDTLDKRVTMLDEKVDTLDKRVNVLDKDVRSVEVDLQEVKQGVIKTNLILENEIRVNIQRVAEGHLDLSRNIYEAMKPIEEIVLLSVKVRMLETYVSEVREKLA